MGSSSSTSGCYDGNSSFYVKHTRNFDEKNAGISASAILNAKDTSQNVYGLGVHKSVGNHTVGIESYTNGYKSINTNHNIGKDGSIYTSTSISGPMSFHIGIKGEF